MRVGVKQKESTRTHVLVHFPTSDRASFCLEYTCSSPNKHIEMPIPLQTQHEFPSITLIDIKNSHVTGSKLQVTNLRALCTVLLNTVYNIKFKMKSPDDVLISCIRFLISSLQICFGHHQFTTQLDRYSHKTRITKIVSNSLVYVFDIHLSQRCPHRQ